MACSYYFYHHCSNSFFVAPLKDKYNTFDGEVLAIGLCRKFNTWELYSRIRKYKHDYLIKEIYFLKYNEATQSFD